jgi:hypothetical protein
MNKLNRIALSALTFIIVTMCIGILFIELTNELPK